MEYKNKTFKIKFQFVKYLLYDIRLKSKNVLMFINK